MKLLRSSARLAGIATLVVAGLVATGTPALADETLPGVKAAVTARIELRLAALAKDTAAINAAKNLTDSHRSTLSGVIAADTSGLNGLKAKVAGETTLAAVKVDAISMVDDYRVFTLVGPQVRLAIAGDAEAVAIATAQQAHDKLATALATAKAAGTDTAAAEADLATMKAAIDKATVDSNGRVNALLAAKPGPDGAAIRAAVATARQGLGAARVDLRAAVVAGKKVTAFLKSLPH